jgi:hypothetical protein
MAAVLGGAVTRERLLRAASQEGHAGSPLIHSLLAQSLPTTADLARTYREAGGVLRLDRSFLTAAPKAARLLDADLMRRERCVPVEILEDLCILAVDAPRAAQAVAAVRAVLRRDVLPVVADPETLDLVLAGLSPPPMGIRQGPLPRKDSSVHERFRDLVLDDGVLDAMSVREATQ